MGMRFAIDINADVGEGVGNEPHLMPYLASCNIACGGHAGDRTSMREVIILAKAYGVKIGAHPSFPDKEHFGRQVLDISAADLYSSLKGQIRNLMEITREQDTVLHHVKPHGALYNLVAKDQRTARVVLEVIKSISMPLKLYAPYNSMIAKMAKQEGIPVIYEAFADRNYIDDLSLVSRQHQQALITKKEAVFKHLFYMVQHEKVKTLSGGEVPIKASTFCLHSDTENSVEIAQYLSMKFKENNIKIQ